MTREEKEKLIQHLKYSLEIGADYTITDGDAIEIIKSLEKESVLDKIKAEIEAKCCITVGRENDGAITLHDVFEIIDKYKVESEG